MLSHRTACPTYGDEWPFCSIFTPLRKQLIASLCSVNYCSICAQEKGLKPAPFSRQLIYELLSITFFIHQMYRFLFLSLFWKGLSGGDVHIWSGVRHRKKPAFINQKHKTLLWTLWSWTVSIYWKVWQFLYHVRLWLVMESQR